MIVTNELRDSSINLLKGRKKLIFPITRPKSYLIVNYPTMNCAIEMMMMRGTTDHSRIV